MFYINEYSYMFEYSYTYEYSNINEYSHPLLGMKLNCIEQSLELQFDSVET